MGHQVPHVPPERRDDRTKNGFLANFQTSVQKSRFRKFRGVIAAEPEVISTCGFHCWTQDTTLGGLLGVTMSQVFPLPVKKFPKSKMSKSHFVKTGHLRSYAAGKPEVVFTSSLRSRTEDDQLRSAQKITRRSDKKRLLGEFSNMVNLVITCPTSRTSADLTGLLWH
jgi:hypothetical protein